MKLLALNGSPRRKRSNTERLLSPVLQGARAEGAEVVHHYLQDLDVRPCTGCMSCWVKTPGRCVIADDMQQLLPEVLSADVVVLGFPLYIFGVPAGVQAFLERLLPVAEPWLQRSDGETRHPMRHADWRPAWLVVCNCGFPEQSHFDALNLKLAHMGIQPVVMAAGEFLRSLQHAPELAEAHGALQSALEEAGRQVVRDGRLSDDLRRRLTRPIIEWAGISADEYADMANQSFRQALDRAGEHETG